MKSGLFLTVRSTPIRRLITSANSRTDPGFSLQARTDRSTLVTLTAALPGSGVGGLGLTGSEGAIVSAGVFTDMTKTPALVALLERKKLPLTLRLCRLLPTR